MLLSWHIDPLKHGYAGETLPLLHHMHVSAYLFTQTVQTRRFSLGEASCVMLQIALAESMLEQYKTTSDQLY